MLRFGSDHIDGTAPHPPVTLVGKGAAWFHEIHRDTMLCQSAAHLRTEKNTVHVYNTNDDDTTIYKAP